MNHSATGPRVSPYRAGRVGLALALLASSLGSQPAARAQEDGQQRRPDRADGDVIVALPLTGEALAAAQSAPTFEGVQSAWGQVVFQSFRDGNWEIYTANDLLGDAQRLTVNAAADVEPRISPDTGRILFTSKRSGNFDLFVTERDGDPVIQLTTDPAVDSGAAWSPDGSRVAFQSNRLGNSDVWVMNADGSGQTVLTTNLDYDGEPTWSPDGSRIAFISRRAPQTHDYALYVMNADGSNPQLLSDWPGSSRPAWSPDGRLIIFDGTDFSGWQRVMLYEVATGVLQTHPTSDDNADIQTGAWAVRDTYYVTRVGYMQANGAWYITQVTPHFYQASNAMIDYAFGGPYDGWPSWFSLDRVPPTSETPAVWNTYQSLNAHRLFIYAVDDRSTIGWYEMQKRSVPDGAWTSGEPDGCNTLPTGVGVCNAWANQPVTDIRVRAIDSMGNAEPWPTDPAKWVRIYGYSTTLSGVVTDVRGRPLAGVTVAATHTFEGTRVTSSDGRFTFHLADEEEFVVTATIAGDTTTRVKAPELMTLDGSYWVEMTLQNPTTYVVNGSFVNGLDGWTNAGAGPLLVVDRPGRDDARFLELGAMEPGGTVTGVVSAISQTVSLPASLTEPTLSFAYHHGYGADTGVPFFVTVAEIGSAAAPTRLEYPRVWAWSPIWVDLTPWLGKTISITFSVSQDQSPYTATAAVYDLDDVAVGSATRPQIDSFTPTDVATSAGLLTVSGSGFNADAVVTVGGAPAATTWVNAQTLTATLPPGVPWGRQPVRVVDAAGFAAEAIRSLLVGHALDLPNVFRYWPGEVQQGWP